MSVGSKYEHKLGKNWNKTIRRKVDYIRRSNGTYVFQVKSLANEFISFDSRSVALAITGHVVKTPLSEDTTGYATKDAKLKVDKWSLEAVSDSPKIHVPASYCGRALIKNLSLHVNGVEVPYSTGSAHVFHYERLSSIFSSWTGPRMSNSRDWIGKGKGRASKEPFDMGGWQREYPAVNIYTYTMQKSPNHVSLFARTFSVL